MCIHYGVIGVLGLNYGIKTNIYIYREKPGFTGLSILAFGVSFSERSIWSNGMDSEKNI